jgi:hypothetical protein
LFKYTETQYLSYLAGDLLSEVICGPHVERFGDPCPIQWVRGCFPPEVKRGQGMTLALTPSRAEVKSRIYASSAPWRLHSEAGQLSFPIDYPHCGLRWFSSVTSRISGKCLQNGHGNITILVSPPFKIICPPHSTVQHRTSKSCG